MQQIQRLLGLVLCSSFAAGCGGGVPVQLVVDEFTVDVEMAAVNQQLEQGLQSLGTLPPGMTIPERWPDSLPRLQHSIRYATPPVPVSLEQDEADANSSSQYEAIDVAQSALRRIELNRLIVRVERNNLTVPLPELTLQVADSPNANPDDRLAWFTIGHIPGIDAGRVDDLEFTFEPGGESFLNAQMGADKKEFAIRAVANIEYDSQQTPLRPRGVAQLRLIVVTTFFIDPEAALDATDRSE